MKKCISIIKNGGVAVIKTDTLYGIVGSAHNQHAVDKIYKIKGRSLLKPVIVLISDISDVQKLGIDISVDFIKKYIDLMARLKMNTFHWHLTEDQAWRIQIKQYPKLTEVGAWRKETLVGHARNRPMVFDGTPHSGFYTHEDVKEIVQYASDRFVTIVPEIEMPGHSQAAIAAYPELGCTSETIEVAKKWGVFEAVYCTNDETFGFLEDVLDEVLEQYL